MSLLHKLGMVGARTLAKAVSPRAIGWGYTYGPSPSYATPVPVESAEITRVSIGLKEFLWNLDGIGHGTMLDLGPASQTTISFFLERGFRTYSDDLLRSWKEFRSGEEKLLESAVGGALEPSDLTPEGRAERFLKSNLRYPARSFDAILLWDRLDYLEPVLVPRVVASLTEMLTPGGVVFGLFHSRKPGTFRRYRVVDSMTLQMVPAGEELPLLRIYQNRKIQDLFPYYRGARSFVSRDQLREVLFIK